MRDIFDKISKLTNVYSESIHVTHNIGDTVKVGGKIKSIIDVSILLSSKEAIIDFKIDDGLGVFTLRVLGSFLNELEIHYGQFKVGDLILAHGLFSESVIEGDSVHNLIIAHLIEPI